ncbi:MAG: DNA mismatch repair protein MutS [Hyphomicrobiaceae bacterium]|nr:MAG: DNA mismatch repair protein MutS [Hyphomicrobiaceae bacterium]
MRQDDKKGKGRRAVEQPAQEPAAAPEKGGGVTPSMAQFLEIKAANPDCLLFYRMGDFYELFFEDAVAAAEALGIVLTKRGKHLGEDIPMCGVPIHRADEYLQRLIRQGFRVAVCEQLEDPAEARKRGSKAVVRRDVVRLVTPGTLTEDSLLDAKARNYLTAVFRGPKAGTEATIALASLDLSTGEFEVGEVPAGDFPGEIVRLSPSEVIAADALLSADELRKWIGVAGAAATPVPSASFDSLAGERLLKAQFGVADLAAFGTFSRPELAAIGALLKYVELTQIGKKPCLRPPRKAGPADRLAIDAATRASLELLRSTSGDRRASLLGALDRTVTGPGARELAARLASPLRDLDAIAARLDAVGFLGESETLREDLRATLKAAPDIARAIARLALQRGGPRDLAAVRDALLAAAACARLLLNGGDGIGLPDGLARIAQRLTAPAADLADCLARALVDEPPPLRRDGGFVRSGYRADLDEARGLRDDSRKVMAALEAKYLDQTGIKSLKVRHNNILGFYVEVPAGAAKPLMGEPLAATFRHRQTMAGAVRFATEELMEIESRIVTSAERALAIEQEVFAELSGAIAAEERALSELAAALAELDCEAALAQVAVEENYARPVLDDGTTFEIRGGRHPVVEQALKAARAGAFIENDCVLAAAGPEAPTGFDEMTGARIWLVTGPNMAGKSTFLRQNALITVMAQMGSFVPARSAQIGLVDRLFSRVGAADDLARGRSTFMVEMVETAGILNQATARSLVILDEIGRGTATFDGLSIAWAVVEYLHEVNKCRALFATHYHELTALAGRLAEVANVTMDVREWRDEIVFLHKVRPGAADRSYGIQVAKLAGLPKPVTRRAAEVLELLERSESKAPDGEALLTDLPLFATRPRPQATDDHAPLPLEQALTAINPDDLTPKAALEALYMLKELAAKGRR